MMTYCLHFPLFLLQENGSAPTLYLKENGGYQIIVDGVELLVLPIRTTRYSIATMFSLYHLLGIVYESRRCYSLCFLDYLFLKSDSPPARVLNLFKLIENKQSDLQLYKMKFFYQLNLLFICIYLF